jgi:hypothetical protein
MREIELGTCQCSERIRFPISGGYLFGGSCSELWVLRH